MSVRLTPQLSIYRAELIMPCALQEPHGIREGESGSRKCARHLPIWA
jgi:hypothetical protein